MSNDPRDLQGEKLQKALQLFGRDENLRKELIVMLMQAEKRINYSDGSIREDITGPIVDALHTEEDTYEKELLDGTRFQFLFRTKIARDFLMSDQQKPNHVWEPQTTKLLLKLAKERHDDVLVGGAYFGDQAILLAKAINGSGRMLHGFEPNTVQADMFAKNAVLNDLRNIEIQKLGLWSQSSVKLKLDGFDSFANAIEATDDESGFQTITIDDYLKQKNRKLSLIQMDIEGAELGALQGARHCLETTKPDILFEVHRSYVDWSNGLENTDICRYLSQFGYHLFAIRDFNSHMDMGNSPIELVPVSKVYLNGPPHGFNMLAIFDINRINSTELIVLENVSPKLLIHKNPNLHHPSYGLPNI
jgi:FkbM family methyltransferase